MRVCSIIIAIIVILLAGNNQLNSAEEMIDLNDLIQQGRKFIEDNFDENFLNVLDDSPEIEEFFKKLQSSLAGEYVIDLATLKDAAKSANQYLDLYEETKPYADWLRARLDYFEVASELKLIIPPPGPEEIKPPHISNPSAEVQRKIWQKYINKTSIPENAKPYVSKLKPIFSSEKVPQELIWIAEVESGFKPQARSPVGAVGMFQFMPETAKRFGLSTFPIDERTNPEKSARAAAKYLRLLSSKFNDWRLAIAAYNVGEGRVQRLLEKTNKKDFDSIATKLPAETQMYVPKVEAAILKREGVKLSELPLMVQK